MAELTALLTSEGLRLLDSLGPVETTGAAAAAVSRLRAAGHGPDLVAAVVGQAHLRAKARAKFGDFADRMLFTRAGLEQATRLGVAARHAGRMRAAGIARVADLGCGIGGDALAFAGAGLGVTAVDADEVTAALAAYNLAPFGDDVVVRHGIAQETDLSAADAVWLDPARRTAGHRETRRVSAADYSPPLDWAFALAASMSAGIKLGPGHDRAALPADAEAQWVSADGSVVELVLWSGALARPGVRRAAMVVRGEETHELVAASDSPDAEVRPLAAYLHEPDGAVIRARLIGDLARGMDAGMLDEKIAYLTSDAPSESPLAVSFRVREVLPLHPKAINAVLRAADVGTVEIKKRGVDIDPSAFRRRLTLKGATAATLLLVRAGERRQAILADRV
ncbi:THUMP-like domain-containing protein [Arenibacterium sp. S380]